MPMIGVELQFLVKNVQAQNSERCLIFGAFCSLNLIMRLVFAALWVNLFVHGFVVWCWILSMFIGSSCRARTTVEIDWLSVCKVSAVQKSTRRARGEVSGGKDLQGNKRCLQNVCQGTVCRESRNCLRTTSLLRKIIKRYYLPPHPPICKHAAYPKTSKTLGLFSLCWQKHKQVYTYIGKGQSETCGNLQKREASGVA